MFVHRKQLGNLVLFWRFPVRKLPLSELLVFENSLSPSFERLFQVFMRQQGQQKSPVKFDDRLMAEGLFHADNALDTGFT